jgi:hypothetical protein
MTRSRFYQRFHRGCETKPLHELPVLTKAELMASFDELVVDPDVRRADVEHHLAELRGNERYLDRYWVSRTAGTTKSSAAQARSHPRSASSSSRPCRAPPLERHRSWSHSAVVRES